MAVPRLWSWNLSPFAGKVRVVAARQGVELDLIEIDPVNRPPRLRELNPTGTVPVLEADTPSGAPGGIVVRESSAICEWLGEVGSGPLWPSDPAARARARGLMRWVDDELTVNFFRSFRLEAFGPGDGDPPDIVERLRGRLMRRWPVLDELLGRVDDGSWLAGGSEPSLADLSALPLSVRIPQWKAELRPPESCPRAVAWLQALRESELAPAVKLRGRPADEL